MGLSEEQEQTVHASYGLDCQCALGLQRWTCVCQREMEEHIVCVFNNMRSIYSVAEQLREINVMFVKCPLWLRGVSVCRWIAVGVAFGCSCGMCVHGNGYV